MNETDVCVFQRKILSKKSISNKSFYLINKVMKCKIWISNTSYMFDYNSISSRDNQLSFSIKLKRTFYIKYIKSQVPPTSSVAVNYSKSALICKFQIMFSDFCP